MNRVIHKYPFGESVRTGANPRILKIAEQYGVIQLWIEVDEYTESSTILNFRMVGTGQHFDPAGYVYLDSILASTGFVWHLYQVA